MEQVEPETKFTFNGKEYCTSEVGDRATYIINQINDLRRQVNDLRTKLDQVGVCEQAFTDMLAKELEESDNVEKE